MADYTLAPNEKIVRELRTTTYRKENFTYVHSSIVDAEGDSWTTGELDEVNLAQVLNQYRSRHLIPFPSELVRMRKAYGLSAAKMSTVMGFGANQWRLYEEGEMPSESNARSIAAVRSKAVFLEYLKASRHDLGESTYNRIMRKVADVPLHVDFSGQSEANGFQVTDKFRQAQIASYLLKPLSETFFAKMNKLLFYSDFVSYKRRGVGMTGLIYKADRFGPVPERYSYLYSTLPTIDTRESQSFAYTGTVVDATSDDFSLITEEDKEILDYVLETFGDYSASKISEYSHREQAWINHKDDRGIIPYNEAFSLSVG